MQEPKDAQQDALKKNGTKSNGRGGKREFAGRPPGVPNKVNAELREILDSVVDWNQATKKLWALCEGVLVQRQNADGSVEVYEKPPNEFALKTLFEFRFGKARQSIDVKDERPVEKVVWDFAHKRNGSPATQPESFN